MTVDTWDLERVLHRFNAAIPEEAWTEELRNLKHHVEYAVADVYDWQCDEEHIGDRSDVVPVAGALGKIEDYLTKIRMGWLEDTPEGTMERVLEEIRSELR